MLKQLTLDSIQFTNQYKKQLQYLSSYQDTQKKDQYLHTFFSAYQANILVHQMYPRFRNRCSVRIHFVDTEDKTYDVIQSILCDELGEPDFVTHSHLYYWKNKEFECYHILDEDRYQGLHHSIILFSKPFAFLIPQEDYIVLQTTITSIAKHENLELKWMTSSYIGMQDGNFEYNIISEKHRVSLYLRKHTRLSYTQTSSMPVESFTKQVSIQDIKQWSQAVLDLIIMAKKHVKSLQ